MISPFIKGLRVRRPAWLALILATLFTIGLVVALYPRRCPVELILHDAESIKIRNETGVPMIMLSCDVRNLAAYRLNFGREAKIEARVAGHWQSVPDLWTVRLLPPGPGKKPGGEIQLLVPQDADACRIRVEYQSVGKSSFPLGLRASWARTHPPSRASLRAQQITARVSGRLYDWLWPPHGGHQPVSEWNEGKLTVTLPVALMERRANREP